jgi:hypothetical protein
VIVREILEMFPVAILKAPINANKETKILSPL